MRGLLLVALLTGCDDTASLDGECVDNGDCSDGKACVEATCVQVDCLLSEDCNIGYYCAGGNECVTGCALDADCQAGDTCNIETNTCETYGCRSTDLDCSYGEYCDDTSGECLSWPQDLCGECTGGLIPQCQGGGTGDCWSLYSNVECETRQDCPDSSSTCEPYIYGGVNYGSYCIVGPYCYTPCATTGGEDCPRGFECWESSESGGTMDICFADCNFLGGQGYL